MNDEYLQKFLNATGLSIASPCESVLSDWIAEHSCWANEVPLTGGVYLLRPQCRDLAMLDVFLDECEKRGWTWNMLPFGYWTHSPTAGGILVSVECNIQGFVDMLLLTEPWAR